MDTLEEQANREAYNDALIEAEELRMYPDFDWADVVDQYDGCR